MDNEYISRFVNSKTIRKHLNRIGYQFTTLQYAYLIWQCKTKTIAEKHKEWNKMIKTTTDCSYSSKAFPDNTSLHKLISDYIVAEDKLINRLKQSEPNTFYDCEIYEYDTWESYNGYYNTYGNCICWDYATENNYKFNITKHYIDNAECYSSYIKAFFNENGEMTDIYCSGHDGADVYKDLSDYELSLITELFDDMWFDFPTPFYKGAIVCDCFVRKPFVLTDTNPWQTERETQNRKKAKDISYKSNMDMNATGYSFDNITNTLHWDWCNYYYMDLEFYNVNNLKDGERFLKAYSMYVKDAIDIDTLLNLYQIIISEKIAQTNYSKLNCFIDEPTKRILGIDKYKGGDNYD